MSSKRSGQSTSSENDDWRNEDPNLLNIPELLYKEAAKLPPRSVERDESFVEILNITNELMLSNNIALETIRKHEESWVSKQESYAVLRQIASGLEDDYRKTFEQVQECGNKPAWVGKYISQVFDERASEHVKLWISSLHQLLDSYRKIQEFIPKEVHDRIEEEGIETSKINSKKLPEIVEELEVAVKAYEFLKE